MCSYRRPAPGRHVAARGGRVREAQFRPAAYEIVVCKVLPYVAAVQSDPETPANLPTVLVMDDEPFVRQAARRFLRGSGYGCVEAESVDAALAILRNTSVIAAMLDMRLQDGRTGIDVLTDLRRLPEFQEIPVMIVTGSLLSDAETAVIAKHRGYVFFKPEGFSTIVNFLDRVTGRDRSS
jgi:CheY-like chemotaxis protein